MSAHGIKILPPDINKSNIEFSIESNQIRFGLGAIKSLGDANLRQIITSRPYNDVYDLVYKAHLNKAVLEILIKKRLSESVRYKEKSFRFSSHPYQS